MSVFGSRLRTLRKERDLGQKEVAAWLNLNYTTIGKYESGERTPNPEVIKTLAEHFNVRTDYLLGTSDDPTPPVKDTVKGLLGSLGTNTQVIEETPKHRVLVDASQGLSDEEMDVLIDMANILRAKHNID
jgi:transcriptional regulator with XRE-family HTH domain